MPQIVICSGCKRILYKGEKLKDIYTLAQEGYVNCEYGDKYTCPHCKRVLKTPFDTVEVTTNLDPKYDSKK